MGALKWDAKVVLWLSHVVDFGQVIPLGVGVVHGQAYIIFKHAHPPRWTESQSLAALHVV